MNTLNAVPIAQHEAKTRKPVFTTMSTEALMAMEFPPLAWIIPDYVAEGLTLLVGRQKLGKTWLAIDWAVAVAAGGFAMGSVPCDAGNVLYIDLENGPRRIRNRLDTLFPGGQNRPGLALLLWVHDAPAIDKGFIDALEHWRLSVRNPRLVIVDVFQRIKPRSSANANAYEADYGVLAPLQRWATEAGVAVVLLHHTRKGGADDPLEVVNGSNGLAACADNIVVLDRDAQGTTLYVRGRDVEEKEVAMSFTGGFWTIAGNVTDVRRSQERSRIIAALEDSDDLISPSEIASVTGMKPGNVRRLLNSMARAGDVRKVGRGAYAHRDWRPKPHSEPEGR